MVLFCLNQIGNPIPNPFNHAAMSSPRSIDAIHHLWQWQEDVQDGIYFMEMDVSVICVTSEGKHLQAEKHPQKLSLCGCVWEWSWHPVAGIRFLFDNRCLGENASLFPSRPALSSPAPSPLKFCLVLW